MATKEELDQLSKNTSQAVPAPVLYATAELQAASKRYDQAARAPGAVVTPPKDESVETAPKKTAHKHFHSAAFPATDGDADFQQSFSELAKTAPAVALKQFEDQVAAVKDMAGNKHLQDMIAGVGGMALLGHKKVDGDIEQYTLNGIETVRAQLQANVAKQKAAVAPVAPVVAAAPVVPAAPVAPQQQTVAPVVRQTQLALPAEASPSRPHGPAFADQQDAESAFRGLDKNWFAAHPDQAKIFPHAGKDGASGRAFVSDAEGHFSASFVRDAQGDYHLDKMFDNSKDRGKALTDAIDHAGKQERDGLYNLEKHDAKDAQRLANLQHQEGPRGGYNGAAGQPVGYNIGGGEYAGPGYPVGYQGGYRRAEMIREAAWERRQLGGRFNEFAPVGYGQERFFGRGGLYQAGVDGAYQGRRNGVETHSSPLGQEVNGYAAGGRVQYSANIPQAVHGIKAILGLG